MADDAPEPGAERPYEADPPDVGGEAVCWLSRVCPDCGRLVEGEPPPARCPVCGTELLV
jgi:rubrerythrin